ncbi:hypothetical protein [Microbacterium terrisoli]|uniref:glycoside hydrolase family 38 N-terminal domain-containing protein n=1 Tax=Microbacterium terrisoli TaxID=3242192 RepID=UPI002803CB4D|nr:hypothetical protein [Microbacterium protaetiae]
MSIRQILLVPHTHHDVGYTNSPRIIDEMHARIVDRVLDLAGAPSAGPDDFRWTFEVARPVIAFMRDAPAERRRLLARLVHDGRISVTGGYLNMTQLPSAFEYAVGYDALGGLREAGLTIRTQQHGDVNGLSWGTVDQMLDAGITRLVMALNPDHGRPPFTQPSGFRWIAPTGRSVFVWLSTHYGFGEEWGIIDGDVPLAMGSIEGFLQRLGARADYPWATALVHAANDNRWPTDRFLDIVRAWNARHPGIPMRTATMDEALDELEGESTGFTLPTVRGEWADWWSHGHGSTAREVAVYREARTFARLARGTLSLARLQGERDVPLAEVLGYRRGPVRLRAADEVQRALAHVDEQLLLYGEHTWGSWETYSKPHSTFSHSSHNAKSAFAYDAFDHARDLAIEGWYRAVHSGAGAAQSERIVVVNTTETDRVELVDVEVDGVRRVCVPAAVPAFSVASFPVPASVEPVDATGPLRAGSYTVLVDPRRGGVVSLRDETTGRELIDPDALGGLGSVVVGVVGAGSSHPMITTSPKMFHPDHPGPQFERRLAVGAGPVRIERGDATTRIRWRTGIPGILSAHAALTIADGVPDIDVDVHVDKSERFVPESVFVVFPFAVTDPRFLLETAGAVFAAESEQLPDTSKDWYSIQHAVGVCGDSGGILWGTRDAPLVQLGGIHTGEWARKLHASHGHVYSWLMNNLHFTNFQARQEVNRTFRYRLRPAVPAPHDVLRYGRDLLEPLQGRHHHHAILQPSSAPLRVEPVGRLLAELAPSDAAGVRVRLHNPEEDAIRASVIPMVAGWIGADVEVSPHGTRDVLVVRVAP